VHAVAGAPNNLQPVAAPPRPGSATTQQQQQQRCCSVMRRYIALLCINKNIYIHIYISIFVENRVRVNGGHALNCLSAGRTALYIYIYIPDAPSRPVGLWGGVVQTSGETASSACANADGACPQPNLSAFLLGSFTSPKAWPSSAPTALAAARREPRRCAP
jgi:hypothetical protein